MARLRANSKTIKALKEASGQPDCGPSESATRDIVQTAAAPPSTPTSFGDTPAFSQAGPQNSSITGISWHSSGQHLATVTYGGLVRVLAAGSSQGTDNPLGEKWHTRLAAPLCDVAWSPAREVIAIAGSELTFVSARDGTCQRACAPAGLGPFNCLAWSPDGSTLATGDPAFLALWNEARQRGPGRFCRFDNQVLHVAWSPDGNLIAAACADFRVHIVRAADLRPLARLKHRLYATSAAWLPDGSGIITGSGDRTVRLWSAPQGERMAQLRNRRYGAVRAVRVSANGSCIAVSRMDDTIEIWDAASRILLRTITHEVDFDNYYSGVQFSPDGRRLAMSDKLDKVVRILRKCDLVAPAGTGGTLRD